MLARIRKSMNEKDQGFTLIELLVVMIIIGILAAIAVPVFLNQRKKAADTATKSDIRAVVNQEETYAVDAQDYASVTTTTSTTANLLAKDGTTNVGSTTLSKSTVVTVVRLKDASTKAGTTDTATGYCITGYSPNGTAISTAPYYYNSLSGGFITSPSCPT